MSPTESSVPPRRCKVLLVEDHPLLREHLGRLINRDLDMEICGEADNSSDAIKLIKDCRPDIAIVDVTLRGSSGLELIKDIKAQGLVIKVLVLSMHDEELFAERALRAGACGYITKKEASAELILAVREVMAGRMYVSKRAASKLLEGMTQPKTKSHLGGLQALSDRELVVFEFLGQGKNTCEIAHSLNLGESSVETYRARIKEKLQLRSSADLYLRAGQWVRENSG